MTTTTDLTITEDQPQQGLATTVASSAASNLRDWALSLADAGILAKAITPTDFVPAHFRGKVGDAAVAILKGAALGLDPIAALESIYVISGRHALYTRTMAAVVLAAGHEVWTEDASDTSVTVQGRRRGSEHVETATWTLQRAELAGYTKNAKYRTDPQSMLYARAVGEVARKVAPDVLLGLSYTAEEIELEDVEPVKIQRKRKADVATLPTPEPDEDGAA